MAKFKVYIDRLRHGDTSAIEEIVPPDFLEIREQELNFPESISIKGEIYLADDHLVTHLNVDTAAFIPCSICNDMVRYPIQINNLYLSKPLADIKNATFELDEDIRESILIQVPQFTECNDGSCPERKSMQEFLEKKPQLKKKSPPESKHFPFSDLG